MVDGEISGVPVSTDMPATPVDSGAAGTQIVAVGPAAPPPPPPLYSQVQHTDYVVSSMRGLGSVPASPEAWQMGVANYEALAHEYRETKQLCRELSQKLDGAREVNADLRVANEGLKSKAPLGVLRTVTSSAFVTIGGMLVGLSHKESFSDTSLTLLIFGLFVLAIGWAVALWRGDQ